MPSATKKRSSSLTNKTKELGPNNNGMKSTRIRNKTQFKEVSRIEKAFLEILNDYEVSFLREDHFESLDNSIKDGQSKKNLLGSSSSSSDHNFNASSDNGITEDCRGYSQRALCRSTHWNELVNQCNDDIKIFIETVEYLIERMTNYHSDYTKAKLASSCFITVFEYTNENQLIQVNCEGIVESLLKAAFSTTEQLSYHNYYIVLLNIVEIIIQIRPLKTNVIEIFDIMTTSIARLKNNPKSYFEAIKCANIFLDQNPVQGKVLPNSDSVLLSMLDNLINVGDIESQLATVELILRIFDINYINCQDLTSILTHDQLKYMINIHMDSFESNCRTFLNKLNSEINTGVISLSSEKVFVTNDEKVEYVKPHDDDYHSLWVDFNFKSQRISIICSPILGSEKDNTYEYWQTISLLKEHLKHYSYQAYKPKMSNNITHRSFELILSMKNPICDLIPFGPYAKGNDLSIIFDNGHFCQISTVLSKLFEPEYFNEKASVSSNIIKVASSDSINSPQILMNGIKEIKNNSKSNIPPKISEPLETLAIKMYSDCINDDAYETYNEQLLLSIKNDSIKTLDTIPFSEKQTCSKSYNKCSQKSTDSHEIETNIKYEKKINNDKSLDKIEHNQDINSSNVDICSNVLASWKKSKQRDQYNPLNAKKNNLHSPIQKKKLNFNKYEIPRIEITPESHNNPKLSQSIDTSLYSFKSTNSCDIVQDKVKPKKSKTDSIIKNTKKMKKLNNINKSKLNDKKTVKTKIKGSIENSNKSKKKLTPQVSGLRPKGSALKFSNLQESLLQTPDMENISNDVLDLDKIPIKKYKENQNSLFNHIIDISEEIKPTMDIKKSNHCHIDTQYCDNLSIENSNQKELTPIKSNSDISSDEQTKNVQSSIFSVEKIKKNDYYAQKSDIVKSDSEKLMNSPINNCKLQSNAFDWDTFSNEIQRDSKNYCLFEESKKPKLQNHSNCNNSASNDNKSDMLSKNSPQTVIRKKSQDYFSALKDETSTFMTKSNLFDENAKKSNDSLTYKHNIDHDTDDDIVSSFTKFCDNIIQNTCSTLNELKSPKCIKNANNTSFFDKSLTNPTHQNNLIELSQDLIPLMSPKVQNTKKTSTSAISNMKLSNGSKKINPNYDKVMMLEKDITGAMNRQNEIFEAKLIKINNNFTSIKNLVQKNQNKLQKLCEENLANSVRIKQLMTIRDETLRNCFEN